MAAPKSDSSATSIRDGDVFWKDLLNDLKLVGNGKPPVASKRQQRRPTWRLSGFGALQHGILAHQRRFNSSTDLGANERLPPVRSIKGLRCFF
jgi:hypothetical protein